MGEKYSPGSSEYAMNKYIEVIDTEGQMQQWILISSPLVLCTVLVYLVFVLKFGPAFMSTRPPFNVKHLMRFYNLVQVAYNCSIIYLALREPGALDYIMNKICHPPDIIIIQDRQKVFLHLLWHFLLLKQLDLLDTVFMVLSKKNSNITFLHVYHHSAMSITTWICSKYFLSQQAIVPGLTNIMVHAIIYAYYFLATFGPRVQRFLHWKKLVTVLQMGQIVLSIVYLAMLNYYDCHLSKQFAMAWLANLVIFIGFFINFYFKTYIRKSKEGTIARKDS